MTKLSMTTPSRAVALLAGGTLLLLGACSSGLKYAGQSIAEPEAFVAQVEAAWKANMGKERMTVHKDFHCYLGKQEGTDGIGTEAFCGPVRHYNDDNNKSSRPTGAKRGERNSGDAPFSRGSGIWDTYRFEATSDVDGTSRLREPVLASIGADLPAGTALVRPDGANPPQDGADLTAPPPPPAKPGLVEQVDDTPVKDAKRPGKGLIVTPKTTLHVEQVGRADVIESSDGRRTPAQGERFVIATFKTEDGPFADDYSPGADDLVDADVTYGLRVGSEVRPIDRGSEAGLEGTYVFSVPKAAKPEVVVTAAGKEQALSLDSGDRTSADIPGLYGAKATAGISRQHALKPYTQGELEVEGGFLVRQAKLSSFDPMLGWAKAGRSWLTIELVNVSITSEISGFDYYDLRLDRTKTAIVKADGKTYQDVSRDEVESDSSGITWDLDFVFDVDEGAKQFDVSLKPTFSFSAHYGRAEPGSGTAPLTPMSFPVSFS